MKSRLIVFFGWTVLLGVACFVWGWIAAGVRGATLATSVPTATVPSSGAAPVWNDAALDKKFEQIDARLVFDNNYMANLYRLCSPAQAYPKESP